MKKNHSSLNQEKDEINLRSLFGTIGKYKWSIIILTVLITTVLTIKIYLMPKYYKSTVTIEVKPDESQGQGFSMGGAALLSMVGGTGSTSSLEKDVTLIKTYRTNQTVLDTINDYLIRYYIYDKKRYKKIEVDDKNISISLSNTSIKSSKFNGLSIKYLPLDDNSYQLFYPALFTDNLIGTFNYNTKVNTEKFSLKITKKASIQTSCTFQLLGTKRYIYEKIITKNINISIDKNSPFLTISYFDTLPDRGENYLKNLIKIYTQQSINDLKQDASININSYNQQLKNIEKRVTNSANILEKFKVDNNIIQPELQAQALVSEVSKISINIANNIYKQELIGTLIQFVQTNDNIDAIAPSLIELGDKVTINLINLIQEQQIKVSNLLIRYKINHPEVTNAQQQVDILQSKVLSNLENLKITLYNKMISLQKMEIEYNKKIQATPKQEQELITFSRNYRINEKLYIYLMQERSAAELKRDKALSRFKIIEAIYTSDSAAKPKKSLLVIVAFLTTLIFMIFLAFFREFIRKGKND